MVTMENAEEVMQILERFTRLKQKEIPKELEDYLSYVAKTGDTVFKWPTLKYLFREKLLNVIKHFHDTSPRIDGKRKLHNLNHIIHWYCRERRQGERKKRGSTSRIHLFALFSAHIASETTTTSKRQHLKWQLL